MFDDPDDQRLIVTRREFVRHGRRRHAVRSARDERAAKPAGVLNADASVLFDRGAGGDIVAMKYVCAVGLICSVLNRFTTVILEAAPTGSGVTKARFQ